MDSRKCDLHLGTVGGRCLSVCNLNYHASLRHATHIGPAFLDITKDGISDTNASTTRAEMALYDITLLSRLRRMKVAQPLIVFIFRHCSNMIECEEERANKSCNNYQTNEFELLDGNDPDEGAM